MEDVIATSSLRTGPRDTLALVLRGYPIVIPPGAPDWAELRTPRVPLLFLALASAVGGFVSFVVSNGYWPLPWRPLPNFTWEEVVAAVGMAGLLTTLGWGLHYVWMVSILRVGGLRAQPAGQTVQRVLYFAAATHLAIMPAYAALTPETIGLQPDSPAWAALVLVTAVIAKTLIVVIGIQRSTGGNTLLGGLAMVVSPESLAIFSAVDLAGVAIILVLAALVFSGFVSWWRRERYPLHCCQHCGYNLTGNVSGTCPECGTPAPARSPAVTPPPG